MLGGTKSEFFEFIDQYKALIQKHIPGDFDFEYDSRLYMLPVHRHLESIVRLLPKGARLLDLGCGRGHYSAYLEQRGLKATGLEVHDPRPGDDFLHNQDRSVLEKYPALMEEASKKHGFSFSYFDGKNLPFPAESFEAVLFYATFEHVPVSSIEQIVREAARVLVPGGWVFVFRCPSALAWKEHLTRRLGLGAHEKLYGKKEILGLLKNGGFTVRHFDRSDFFPVHVLPIQKTINALAGPLLWLEALLKWTPLRFFFHHFEISARKDGGK
jgi:SAM-dependent methyltransferase